MTNSTADRSPVCFRCDDPLDGAHWVRLTVVHQGDVAEDYTDVETRVCPDCLAAMGLLEFDPPDRQHATRSRSTQSIDAAPSTDKATDAESSLSQYTRLAPLRSLRGGD